MVSGPESERCWVEGDPETRCNSRGEEESKAEMWRGSRLENFRGGILVQLLYHLGKTDVVERRGIVYETLRGKF